MSKSIISIIIFLFFIVSCSNNKKKVDVVLDQQDIEKEMIFAYKEAMQSLEEQQYQIYKQGCES